MSPEDRRGKPVIIFVPGMKPKPEPHLHQDALWRCLLAGLAHVDEEIAADVASDPEILQRADWTWAFYQRYRDIEQDLPGIEQMIAQGKPSDEDIREASSLRTRISRAVYLLADAVPFLINNFAASDMRVTLRDVNRYLNNSEGIANIVRADLRARILQAHALKQPVLLIGHSLGSVIAWDTLWELSRAENSNAGVDLFMTLGSPLGNNLFQRNIKGAGLNGPARYPSNINRWVNMVAIGELTALDRSMRNDFSGMEAAGLIDSIEDYDVFNHYRENSRLLVHSEYGYLANEVTAGIIAEWIRAQGGNALFNR